MISSLAWVPAGVADPSPKRYEVSKTEQELLKMMEEQGDTAELEAQIIAKLEEKNTTPVTLPKIENNLPADLRMDEYSSEEDEGMAVADLVMGEKPILDGEEDTSDNENDHQAEENDLVSASSDSEDDDDLADVPDTREFAPVNVDGLEAMGLAASGGTGGMYADIHADAEDDDSDIEDIKLTADDAVLVVAKTEEDFANLEVHVYDQRTGNLFIHHDIPLPSYPLCVAHGQVSSGGTTGNFCAVGTFSPGIEIWNLDVLNALEPSCVLGGEDTSMADELLKLQMLRAASGSQPSKKFGRPHEGSLRPGSHREAVMSLSWNQVHKQVIASGSADCTVKLWDVTQANGDGNCNASTFSHHRDKVQCVEWHPTEGTLLATGSFDRTVALIDARSNGENAKTVKLGADCEALAWDPFHPEYLTVASEDGTVNCWDVRKFQTSTPLWSFVANEYGGLNNLSYNPSVPGMMATCSSDATVALWDAFAGNNSPTVGVPPRPCGSKDMCVGKLYTIGFYPSSPWLLGCGGAGNQIAIWDLSSEESIQARFDTSRRSNDTVEDDTKETDFEAMMAEKPEITPEGSARTNSSSKKKKGKGKKKAHKRGR